MERKDGKITDLKGEILQLRGEINSLEIENVILRNQQLRSISATEYRIGNIIYNPGDKIGPGSTGNIVYKGKIIDDSGDRECAVKKIPIIKPKDLERARD